MPVGSPSPPPPPNYNIISFSDMTQAIGLAVQPLRDDLRVVNSKLDDFNSDRVTKDDLQSLRGELKDFYTREMIDTKFAVAETECRQTKADLSTLEQKVTTLSKHQSTFWKRNLAMIALVISILTNVITALAYLHLL